MKNKRRVALISMVCLSVILLIVSGCGKKGPPVPPVIKGEKILAPVDLKYTRDGQEIRLTWRHDIDTETAFVKPEGFDVFMAKKTFEACEGCPFEFETVGGVDMPSMEFVISIEKGFKYYFRVQAIGDDNMRSGYSKTIQFEYK